MFHRCLLHLLMSAFNGPAFSAGYRMAVHDVYVHSNTHICPATDGREAFENVPRGLGSSDPAYSRISCSEMHLGLAFVSQPCGHVSSEDHDARALAVRMHTTALLLIAISSSPAMREMHAMGLRLRCTHGNSRSRRAHLPC